LTLHAPPDQDIIVIGATGDLASRKLLPALYNLFVEGLLPQRGAIIGAAPLAWTRPEFVEHARSAIRANSRTGIEDEDFSRFAERLAFASIGSGGDLSRIREAVTLPRRLAYLAVPASAFAGLASGLGTAGLADGTAVVIEKPFGHDARSATALNGALHAVFAENSIFRIDHYLGKETVQNLLVFRFGNALFERVWNRDAIAWVEITVAETLGVEQRGAFYEETGAVRDIVQNHLFQLLAVVAMEPPVSFEAEALRNEKIKVLRAVQPIDPATVVRGQYTAGSIDGERMPGYREEPGVDERSETETFVAMQVHVDTWRWSGVPFLLRTGKRLAARETRVVVVFRDVPLHLFADAGVHSIDENQLIVRIQPDEGIALTFVAKQPGPELTTQTVRMDFSYGGSFKTSPPEAYERLIHDALNGDHTLFIREDEVERGWAIVEPLLEEPSPTAGYPAGSWGPDEAVAVAHPGHWHAGTDVSS